MIKLRHAAVCGLGALGLVLPLGLGATGAQATAAATSANLIKNPGAEQGAGSSDGSVVPVPQWTEISPSSFTAVQYGATGGFPTSASPGPAMRGKNFFAGGPSTESATVVQTVSLAKFVSAIKAGNATFSTFAWVGGLGSLNDSGFVELDFKNASGSLVGTSITLGPVTAAQRNNVTGLLKRAASGKVPKAARSVFVQISMITTGGGYNDGFADTLSFKVTTP